MLRWLAGLLLLFALPCVGQPLEFVLTGSIVGSDVAKAPKGAQLSARMFYNPGDLVRRVGNSHYPSSGTAGMEFSTAGGFRLLLPTPVLGAGTQDGNYYFFSQSFLSESANDWHYEFNINQPVANGPWIEGTELPRAFPQPLEDAYITLYFTDEYEWVRVIEATVDSVVLVEPEPLDVRVIGLLLLIWGDLGGSAAP